MKTKQVHSLGRVKKQFNARACITGKGRERGGEYYKLNKDEGGGGPVMQEVREDKMSEKDG
jgi:hypothetical protein